MNEALQSVARELVAHERFPGWGDGMQVVWPAGYVERIGVGQDWLPSGEWPDLNDPATAGVLFAMLTDEAESEVFAACYPTDDGVWFTVDWGEPLQSVAGESLGEACARALLALWGSP